MITIDNNDNDILWTLIVESQFKEEYHVKKEFETLTIKQGMTYIQAIQEIVWMNIFYFIFYCILLVTSRITVFWEDEWGKFKTNQEMIVQKSATFTQHKQKTSARHRNNQRSYSKPERSTNRIAAKSYSKKCSLGLWWPINFKTPIQSLMLMIEHGLHE